MCKQLRHAGIIREIITKNWSLHWNSCERQLFQREDRSWNNNTWPKCTHAKYCLSLSARCVYKSCTAWTGDRWITKLILSSSYVCQKHRWGIDNILEIRIVTRKCAYDGWQSVAWVEDCVKKTNSKQRTVDKGENVSHYKSLSIHP